VTGGWKGVIWGSYATVNPRGAYQFFAGAGFDPAWLDGGASLTWYLCYSAGELLSFLSSLAMSVSCGWFCVLCGYGMLTLMCGSFGWALRCSPRGLGRLLGLNTGNGVGTQSWTGIDWFAVYLLLLSSIYVFEYFTQREHPQTPSPPAPTILGMKVAMNLGIHQNPVRNSRPTFIGESRKTFRVLQVNSHRLNRLSLSTGKSFDEYHAQYFSGNQWQLLKCKLHVNFDSDFIYTVST
jgi:hypothetical protein